MTSNPSTNARMHRSGRAFEAPGAFMANTSITSVTIDDRSEASDDERIDAALQEPTATEVALPEQTPDELDEPQDAPVGIQTTGDALAYDASSLPREDIMLSELVMALRSISAGEHHESREDITLSEPAMALRSISTNDQEARSSTDASVTSSLSPLVLPFKSESKDLESEDGSLTRRSESYGPSRLSRATGDDGFKHPWTRHVTPLAASNPVSHNPLRFNYEYIHSDEPLLDDGSDDEPARDGVDVAIERLSQEQKAKIELRYSVIKASATKRKYKPRNDSMSSVISALAVSTIIATAEVQETSENGDRFPSAAEGSKQKGKHRDRLERPQDIAREESDRVFVSEIQKKFDRERERYLKRAEKLRRKQEALMADDDTPATEATSPETNVTQGKSRSKSKSTTPAPVPKKASDQITKDSFLYDVIIDNDDDTSGGSSDSSDSLDDASRPAKGVKASKRKSGQNSPTPSSSSSDQSEPESSDTSNNGSKRSQSAARKKHRQKKKETSKRSGLPRHVKCPEPAVYDGSPKIELYEQWVYETRTWIDMSGIAGKYKVASLKRFLTGKAGRWFVEFVARKIDSYKLSRFYRDLMDYCFPAHFKRIQRERFDKDEQGSRTVREYARDLRTMANRLPDINETQLRLKFWKGASQYLRIKWLEEGMEAETDTMDALEEAAERFEKAHLLKNNESNKGNSTQRQNNNGQRSKRNNGYDQGNTKNQNNNQNGQDHNNNRPHRHNGKPKHQGKSFGNKGGFDRSKKHNNQKGGDGKGKSKEKIAELRAANKCFVCEEVGHLSKDCPKRNTAAKPYIRSNAISFKELDELVEIRDNLPAMSVDFAAVPDVDPI
ncbi:hypothetical protein FRB93_011952 [Tulasnella sp. JGI-2019a]|nr:hypothetical protein FRB93_011952 [Tulasnella sp. JGI-2019a]